MRRFQIREGDALTKLAELEAGSIQTCVTSPPYFGLRDYGMEGQLGLEKTPEAYVTALVAVFREVRRVLRDDGTCWLNLGDSYASVTQTGRNDAGRPERGRGWAEYDIPKTSVKRDMKGYKPKDLIGIPWMVAFALRADGWYLRSDIIWSKPNPMPESVTDRPTKAHEYIFLLSKSGTYFYDADAIAEQAVAGANGSTFDGPRDLQVRPNTGRGPRKGDTTPRNDGNGWNSTVDKRGFPFNGETRNKRTVWTVVTQAYGEAHFATFPPELIKPCILAGSREGDTVLDPFAGSGTTGLVALRHNRHFIGVELNPEYCEMARRRVLSDAPLFNEQVA